MTCEPIDREPAEVPLTPLQLAYLAGRELALPLGGVGMRDFREYEGNINAERLAGVVRQLVSRHEALRLCPDPERLTQHVVSGWDNHLEVVDLSDTSAAEAMRITEGLRNDIASYELPVGDGPLLRMLLVVHPSDAPAPAVLFLSVDSLIIDGAGIGTLISEALTLYRDPSAELPSISRSLLPQLSEVANRRSLEGDEDFWASTCAAMPPIPALPWRRALDSIETSGYARVCLPVDESDWTRAQANGRARKLFPNTVVLLAVTEALRRWSENKHFRIGVPLGLPHRPGDPLGPHSEFTIIGVGGSIDETVEERARAQQAAIFAAVSHRSVSGTAIARELATASGQGLASPVTFTNATGWASPPLPHDLRLVAGQTRTPQVALDIRIVGAADGGLALVADFAEEALHAADVDDLMAATASVLRRLGDDEAWERRHLIEVDLSARPAPQSNEPFADRIRKSLIENLVTESTEREAIVCGRRRLTYRELGAQVTSALSGLSSAGVKPGDVIAISADKSVEQIAITLACAIGAITYVPIDPDAPAAKVQKILERCSPALHVTDSTGIELIRTGFAAAGDVSIPDELVGSEAQYHLFTSGSTGDPKGVVINRNAVEKTLMQTVAAWGVGAEDVMFGVTSLHHDMSVFDTLATFVVGAKLVLPTPAEKRDAVAWSDLSDAEAVTAWVSVPAIMEMMLSCIGEGGLRKLRLALLGGDWVTGELVDAVRAHAPNARVASVGGPTETTVWNIWHEPAKGRIGPVPYGRPLPGNDYHVLDSGLQPCPAGVTGRLYCTGIGVADGYLNDPDSTARSFVTVPGYRGDAERAFRTGDLGRFDRNGVIEFRGRADGFVKVRGVRIEPGEVEAVILGHPSVKAVAVLPVDLDPSSGAGQELVAAYVLSSATAGKVDLERFAREFLSPAHIPTRWVPIESLPLTANGKPDRLAVAEAVVNYCTARERERLAPRESGLDWAVRRAIGEVTGVLCEDIGADIGVCGIRPHMYGRLADELSGILGGLIVPRAEVVSAATPRDLAQRLKDSKPGVVEAADLARDIELMDDDQIDSLLSPK